MTKRSAWGAVLLAAMAAGCGGGDSGAVGPCVHEYRTPVHAADAATGLAELLLADGTPALCHIAGPERLSRWEFGHRFCRAHGLPTTLLEAAECQDAGRPRDVSMVSDVPLRSRAEMLAEC